MSDEEFPDLNQTHKSKTTKHRASKTELSQETIVEPPRSSRQLP